MIGLAIVIGLHLERHTSKRHRMSAQRIEGRNEID